MFLFRRNKKVELLAPIAGESIDITKVSDMTFSEKILGDGIAIIPSQGRVVSPVDGTVEQMFDTGHAASIRAENGLELLIHVGIDTVELKGEHFTPLVSSGAKVKVGDPLMEFDPKGITKAGYEIVSPIVILNTPDYSNISIVKEGAVKELQPVMELEKK